MNSDNLEKAVNAFKSRISSIKAGAVKADHLDSIGVEMHGQVSKVNHLANINILDSHTLSVMPWDKKIVKEVYKAIQDSNLNVTPSLEGDVIRVPFPKITEERRMELKKIIKEYAEDAKVSVRSVRRAIMEKIKIDIKDGHVSKDDGKRQEKEAENIVTEYISKIDTLLEKKGQEIMKV